MSSTICAIATPAGGAIGLVRVSGSEAVSITSSIFVPQSGTPLTERKANSLTFGRIVDPTNGETVDEVLVSLFRAPHSYTGEDATEISCHGSAYILSRVVQLLIEGGCVMAQPGEYTQRAFLNGKMDLSQAEAVADLIASTTAANHRMAMQQLRGTFSKRLNELRDKLLHLTSLMELELDFSDHEELEFADRSELLAIATDAEAHIARLCDSFRLGNALKRGVPVAIVGETNAGKSTLLNALVGEERALVSDVHGTTRDTVEESVNLGGTLVRFIDTAGIRDTDDVVERMGIERTFRKMEEADIVVWLLDASDMNRQYAQLCSRIFEATADKRLIAVVNKADLLSPTLIDQAASLGERSDVINERATAASLDKASASDDKASASLGEAPTTLGVVASASSGVAAQSASGVLATPVSSPIVSGEEQSDITLPLPLGTPLLYISAQSEADVDRFRSVLSDTVQHLTAQRSSDDVIVSNARHYEALSSAREALQRVIDGLHTQLSGDFISQDLRECLHHLSTIVGEVTSNDVLQNIFHNFCVGK